MWHLLQEKWPQIIKTDYYELFEIGVLKEELEKQQY
jgi:hypothetical protein